MNKRLRGLCIAAAGAMLLGAVVYLGFIGGSKADVRRTADLDLDIDHEICVLSQNLRVASSKDGVENTILKRKDRLAIELDRYNPDIRCFQECTMEWQGYLTQEMNTLEYANIFNFNNKGLCNPIYVKRTKFRVLDAGSILLSERTSAKSDESRVASWAKLKHRKTGKTLLMVNAHLGLDLAIQQDSCRKLMNLVSNSDADGYLICGDFNFYKDYNPEAYKIMLSNNTKDMAIAASGEGIQGITGGTFHDYGRKTSPKRIDFFFGSSNLTSKFYSLVNDTYNGYYMSDHYGLLNYIDIKSKRNTTNNTSNNDGFDVIDSNNGQNNTQQTVNTDGNQTTPQGTSCEVKVLSQNLRVNNMGDGLQNTLAARLPRIKQIIQKYNADINCFQECSTDWKPKMDQVFPSTSYYSVYMKTNVGHCNPVYINKSKYILIDSGNFEISSAASDTAYNENRVASWVTVKDKVTGKTLLMLNGHLTTIQSQQANSCNKIMNFVKSKNVDGYLMCGDFNFTKDSNQGAYSVMTNGAKDMAIAAGSEGVQGVTGGTFHDYGRRTNKIRIDFFFGSPQLVSKEYTVVNDMFNGQYASDHYGIFNKVVIK